MVSPDTVEAALERVKTAGGKVLSDIISISCGQFAYCLDPDGNSIGIYSH
jgi:predicted enzyme related to lactoylglutathione lyase